MEPAILGLVLDSSIIIEAERKHQTVEELLDAIQQRFGEIEIAMSAITVAELVHGIARGKKQEIRDRRRACSHLPHSWIPQGLPLLSVRSDRLLSLQLPGAPVG